MRIRLSLRRWLLRNFGVLALLPAFLNPASAEAQNADPNAGKYFSKVADFQLPIAIDDKLRANLKEVQLWMKSPEGTWQRQQVALPSERNFKYRAPADGEYSFTLVTLDPRGMPKPSDLGKISKQEIVTVIVDTQPPTVDVQPVKVASGEYILRCSVSDANPDLRSLKITYQGQDNVTRAFEPVSGQPGSFRVPGPEALATPVRVTVSDLAENVTNREVSLQDSMAKLTAVAPPPAPANTAAVPTPTPAVVHSAASNVQQVVVPVAPSSNTGSPVVHQAVAPVAPPPNTGNSNVQHAGGQAATPIGSVVVQQSSPAPANPAPMNLSNVPAGPITTTSVVQIIDSRPTPITAAPGAASTSSGPQRQLLNTTKASLEYRVDPIGPSGVGKVEVWLTADQGATWKRLCEDADKRSPAEFDLPGDGLFGVRVVVTNGNGFGGRAPLPGDQPQMWIETDVAAPVVQLREVEPVASSGSLDIRWTVNDKNLGAEPISLYYAARREGPWLPIVRGLKNDGSYRWAFPRDVGAQFFLRLEAVDQAGNIARCDSQNALVLDVTEPRTTVIGVTGIQIGSIRQ